jgi:hypothetical protein
MAMTPAGFGPAIPATKTYDLDHAAAGVGEV